MINGISKDEMFMEKMSKIYNIIFGIDAIVWGDFLFSYLVWNGRDLVWNLLSSATFLAECFINRRDFDFGKSKNAAITISDASNSFHYSNVGFDDFTEVISFYTY